MFKIKDTFGGANVTSVDSRPSRNAAHLEKI